MTKKDFIKSLLLHLSPLLILIIFHGGGHGKGNNTKTGSDKEIEEKTKEEPLDITIKYGSGHHKPKPINKVHNKDCPNGSYGGLGIATDLFDDVTILDVVKGYVGYDIGLEAGDKITSPVYGEIKGEVGTELNLVVLKKNGETKTYLIVRDKICLKGSK